MAVSILVLMEFGLKDFPRAGLKSCNFVSILVLMEFGLKVILSVPNSNPFPVSILVLMEFGLREKIIVIKYLKAKGFNPCFNGIWFKSLLSIKVQKRLNGVSILVLMEFGLKENYQVCRCKWQNVVSILVLMEFGLKGTKTNPLPDVSTSFNPCFNGIWFKRIRKQIILLQCQWVSILVLMEFGLKVISF